MAWYIGLMSGTSLDGVDGVLARFDDRAPIRSAGHVHRPFPGPLRQELLALNRPGDNELHRAALAGNAVARVYAGVVDELLTAAGVAVHDVAAIGAHGQTVRHRPREFDGCGYTLQLLNGALLAELTGVDVVCDFRSRDVAAGGEGAPLVPAFHAACFARPGESVAVLNVGGIANLTVLQADGGVIGFDCGPGNLLMDLWSQRHQGLDFDAGGAWAAQGTVAATLLERWLADPYFARMPPKSTGRDLFDAAWLDASLRRLDVATVDVMATLAEFSARAAADALHRHGNGVRSLWVCGGGALNTHLMRRLAALCTSAVAVATTATQGVPVDEVEALAFAWLAAAHRRGDCGNLAAVTGARGPRVLGAMHPGG